MPQSTEGLEDIRIEIGNRADNAYTNMAFQMMQQTCCAKTKGNGNSGGIGLRRLCKVRGNYMAGFEFTSASACFSLHSHGLPTFDFIASAKAMGL